MMGALPRAAGLLAGAALALLLACAAPAARPPADADFAPLLWRARAPGGGVLYLLGSVHLGSERVLELGRSVEAAYARADELVVEVDLTRTSPLEMVQLTRDLGRLPPDRSLGDVLSPESHALLLEYLAEREFPVDQIEHFEPWLVTVTLAALELQGAGYQSELGVDQLFLGRAVASRKPIVGLETVESQLAMLDALPEPIQELMLLDVLVRQDRFREEAAGLMRAWERGDERELAELLFGPQREYPELSAFYERVFFERNAAMEERLRALAADGRTRLVVLGAGHMVGPRGIPALLADRGFAVDRVGAAGAD